jgi:hypothetical protein
VKRTKRERPVWWPAFVLAAVGVLALLVVPQARSVDTSAAPSGVQPASVDKPALRQLIEEETRRREQAPRADKAALRAARDAKAAAVPADPAAPTPPVGIVDDVQGALPTSPDRLLNGWQGEVDGHFVVVYAGAKADDPAQGLVVVVTMDRADAARFSQDVLATPIEARRGTGRRGPASARHATGGVRGNIHDRRGRPPLRLASRPPRICRVAEVP